MFSCSSAGAMDPWLNQGIDTEHLTGNDFTIYNFFMLLRMKFYFNCKKPINISGNQKIEPITTLFFLIDHSASLNLFFLRYVSDGFLLIWSEETKKSNFLNELKWNHLNFPPYYLNR